MKTASFPGQRLVQCDIEHVEIKNDDGIPIDGVCATCSLCKHEVESFGTSTASARRCLAIMRQECPHDASHHFYTADDSRGGV
jgi:hypothetical protein